jgi:hypothetical protein
MVNTSASLLNAFVMVIGHTECSQSTTQQTRVALPERPHELPREGAAASVIFALLFCGPLSAFAQRAHKLVDTFDQRYPVEQVPTPPSIRHDAPQIGPPAPHQPAEPPESQNVIARGKAYNRAKTSTVALSHCIPLIRPCWYRLRPSASILRMGSDPLGQR